MTKVGIYNAFLIIIFKNHITPKKKMNTWKRKILKTIF